jgi:hypothetical protein
MQVGFPMTYKPGGGTKSIFRVDLFSEKFNTFGDIEKCLRELADDLHSGSHDIHNDNGEVVGRYGIVRLLR